MVLMAITAGRRDKRSFSLNDEAKPNTLDPGFAARQRELRDCEQRPWTEKLHSERGALLGSQL